MITTRMFVCTLKIPNHLLVSNMDKIYGLSLFSFQCILDPNMTIKKEVLLSLFIMPMYQASVAQLANSNESVQIYLNIWFETLKW